MDTRLLSYFVAAARECHFTRAAEYLNISQSALSQQISLLEAELDVRLFHRTSRRIELTDEGRYLYETVLPLLSQLAEVKADIRQIEKTRGKQLRVASVPSAASLLLPSVLIKLRQAAPAVETQLHECSSLRGLQLLRERQVHASIIRTPYDLQGLQVRELSREPIVVVVSPGHPLAGERQIHLHQLADELFILFDPQQANALSSIIWATCLEAGFFPRVLCEGPELLTMANLVSAGLGVALMPQDMTRLIPANAIAVLELKEQQPVSSLALVWDENGYLPQSVQLFIDLMTNG